MSEKQEKLLEIARSLIGTPYKYAAKPEDIPAYLDCSSFTQYAYKQLGINIPRSTLLQAAKAGVNIQSTTLEVGDLLFFRGLKGHYDDELFLGEKICIGHVGIYSGDDNIIHGAYKNGKVEEAPLDWIIKEKGPVVLAKRIL